MSCVQTSAQVDLERLIVRLNGLGLLHKKAGRVSHSQGVQSAINLIKRERKAERSQSRRTN